VRGEFEKTNFGLLMGGGDRFCLSISILERFRGGRTAPFGRGSVRQIPAVAGENAYSALLMGG
jgi:hypothetical protein